jgi:hypothetical protein
VNYLAKVRNTAVLASHEDEEEHHEEKKEAGAEKLTILH